MSADDSVISKKEARVLIAKAQSGDTQARDLLIQCNLRLVASVARRFSNRADVDDLFQAGCIGLMHAIDKFDLTYDVQFSTYAVPLIMAEMHRLLREDRTIRVTRHGIDLARRAEDARQALEDELGRSPTPQEIGERIGAAREEVVAALDAMAAPSSLDESLSSDAGESSTTRLDQLRSKLGNPEDSVIDSMALQTALRTLPDVERQVLLWRFVEERRQVEVATLLGVSQAHVSRLERRILHSIREFLA